MIKRHRNSWSNETLEFELAKENVEVMLEVLEEVFPQAGVKLSKVVKK